MQPQTCVGTCRALGYGVMVTLQILVLPFLVRVRVAQRTRGGFCECRVVPKLLVLKQIGLWCNGNTADSGPAFPGSSPGSPTVSVRVVPLGATRFFVPLRKLPCGVALKRVKHYGDNG